MVLGAFGKGSRFWRVSRHGTSDLPRLQALRQIWGPLLMASLEPHSHPVLFCREFQVEGREVQGFGLPALRLGSQEVQDCSFAGGCSAL